MSLLKNVKDIIKGWKNDLIPNKEIEQVAISKIEICNICPLNVSDTCVTYKKASVVKDFNYNGEDRKEGQLVKGCGCPLRKKVRSNSQCPRGLF